MNSNKKLVLSISHSPIIDHTKEAIKNLDVTGKVLDMHNVTDIKKHKPDMLIMEVSDPVNQLLVLGVCKSKNIPSVIICDTELKSKFNGNAKRFHIINKEFNWGEESATYHYRTEITNTVGQILNNLKKRDTKAIENCHKNGMLLFDKNDYKFFKFKDIDFIESVKNYSIITSKGKTHFVTKGLGEIYRELNQKKFLRIHRSYVVNMDRVENIDRSLSFLSISGKELPVSRYMQVRIRDELVRNK